MDRTYFPSVIVLLIVAASLRGCWSKSPNIIFILSDDLGYGDVSISAMVNRTNEIPTPNIQRLADEGMRFLRGYSGQVCAPSRCTLMTGKHLGHCRVRGNGGAYTPLRKTDVTVASVLREKYTTGIVGKWGLGDFNSSGYPLDQGFDYYVGQANQIDCHNWYPEVIQNNTVGNCPVPLNANASQTTCGDHHSKCTWVNDLMSREAVDFIRRNGQPSAAKPFFLYFSTTTPHTGFLAGDKSTYAIPAPYDSRFHYADDMLSMFAGATSAQDDFVGAVLDEVKSLGIDQDTIIFFSGDNGPDSHPLGFFDDPGPFRGKKRSLHEGGIRQTIVARWPGHVTPNTTTQHMFAFWDFLPTAAELGGISIPAGIDGVSAAPLLTGRGLEQKPHEYLYWEFCHGARIKGLLPQQYQPGWIQAVRYDVIDKYDGITEWKGIRSDRGELLLYNLTGDVSETYNLSSKFPDVVQHIVSIMDGAHVEDPYWKSSQNRTDKCCGQCGSEAGCKYPCILINSSSLDGKPRVSPPLYHIAPYHLEGTWYAVSDYDENITSEKELQSISIQLKPTHKTLTISSADNCFHDSVIVLKADRQSRQHQVLLQSGTDVHTQCHGYERVGSLHRDGNTLYIHWHDGKTAGLSSSQWEHKIWKMPDFDFD